MLETDIKAVYERMAAADQPPSRISIPAAHRRGRAKLRMRRAGVVAAPILVAGAVAAIALTGAITSGTVLVPATGARTAPAVAPKYFDPLRPYVSFGWVPPGWPNRPAGAFTRTTQWLSAEISGPNVSPDPQWVSLQVNANGLCHVAGHALKCGKYATGAHLGRQVQEVDRYPAYWVPGSGVHEGTLAWQYARGGWATVQAPSLTDALNAAGNVRFGSAVHSAIRFSAQLTGVPAGWQVNWVDTAYMRNSVHAGSYFQFASAYGITDGPGPAAVNSQSPYAVDPAPASTPEIIGGPFVGRGACPAFAFGYKTLVTRAINGYEVDLITVDLGPRRPYTVPVTAACAADADGALVDIAVGAHPEISAESLFAHHIRLFGPRPDKWSTKPIG